MQTLKPFRPAVIRPDPQGIYDYKGKLYQVNSVMEKNLIQFEDEWQPTVRYTCWPQTDLVFYRALTDFNSKFMPSTIQTS